MSDLVARLRAALDEAEAKARAAGAKAWHVDPEYNAYRVEGDDIVIYDEGGHSEDQAEHIAAWNPARVLRLIERDCATLDHYERVLIAQVSANSASASHARSLQAEVLGFEIGRMSDFWLND